MARLPRPGPMERLTLYAATARRSVRRHGIRPHRALGALHPAMVFVVGCPRSGTTFTAGAIGSVPGYFDLGEVNRLKAAVPDLYGAFRAGLDDEVTGELRRVLRRTQRVAFAAGRRAVEQTPEATFLIGPLSRAFPAAQFVHLVRDGRDVVASLMERGWLAPDHGGVDDAGLPVGRYARFWVESDRAREFEESTEVRRCAWAWRRYESTAASELARLDPARVVHVRYEELAAAPADVAARVGETLGGAPAAAFVRAFSGMHAASVGRHARVLTPAQVAEVRTEVGDLLQDLGYGGPHPVG